MTTQKYAECSVCGLKEMNVLRDDFDFYGYLCRMEGWTVTEDDTQKMICPDCSSNASKPEPVKSLREFLDRDLLVKVNREFFEPLGMRLVMVLHEQPDKDFYRVTFRVDFGVTFGGSND